MLAQGASIQVVGVHVSLFEKDTDTAVHTPPGLGQVP